TNGDTHLGGDDIDLLLVQKVVAELEADPRIGSRAMSAEALQQIRQAVIQAKCDLSEREAAEIVVEAGAFGEAGGAPYVRSFSRSELESLIRPIVERTLGPCRQALTDAGLDASHIDEVILVGGSTRIPL